MAAVITEHQANRLEKDDLNRILIELESLSDEDAKLLAGQKLLPNLSDKHE